MHSTLDKLTPGWPAKANLAFDLVALVCACVVALKASPAKGSLWMVCAAIAIAAWIVGAAILRLYSPATPRSHGDHITLTVLLVVGVSAALAVWERMAFSEIHAFSVVDFFCVSLLWTGAARELVFQPLRARAGPIDDVLVCGTGPAAVATAHMLQTKSGGRRFRVSGFLSFSNEVPHPAIQRGDMAPTLGDVNQLLDVLQKRAFDEVYVAGRVLGQASEMQRIVKVCEDIGIPFALPINPFRLERARILNASASSDGFLHFISTEGHPVQHAVKRLVDIVCATGALLALSPLLIVVAVVIKATSPGPVFFRQRRVGLHGATFNLLKFRSMVVNADALKDSLRAKNEQSGPVFKMKHDPRVTPIGRFIRKFSIDELPQLVNILRGDMTIVGPRPALPEEVAQYKVWQRRRLSVRPGLTCYWQVAGRNAIGFDEWMQLDLRYVDHWSLVEDIKLIAATVPVVLSGRGAS